ncbi:hypothetical protein F442_05371 [Phytophthora nicotianae P10297]|uniref:MULE transposase domain-containing protein n=1 Tax=Phytophthora nicotianae P10297 TaxID=1317064 RepID=W2ZPP3_PHYNI|nr:hypothetical protein F442_05371 [Phytophthora nicotianae P10297]
MYFICIYDWQFKPRGNGRRTNHIIRSIKCPAKLSANLVKEKEGLFMVRVSTHYADHNHVVGEDVYYSYSETRQVNSPATRNVVKNLVQGGSKKTKLLRYLKEVSGKPILPKDVENLIAKMRKETYTLQDDNVRVSQLLKDFSEGPGNADKVFRDNQTGLTSCITFQTAFMRRMARKFPEAVYRCYLRVIIIWKDFTELALLKDAFPGAVSSFHVIVYLKRETHIKNLVTLMVRAGTEESFDHYHAALKELCWKRPGFMDYFEENWLACKALWCMFKRGDIPHLDNNTNNRLEASWGAAKQILNRHMAMDECIDILFLQQSAEDGYWTKVRRVGCRYNQHYDEEMCVLAKLATHHACSLVESEYKLSGQLTDDISKDEATPSLYI